MSFILGVSLYTEEGVPPLSFYRASQALGMEDEDAEMAKVIAKSEEEEEQRLQSELKREGGWVRTEEADEMLNEAAIVCSYQTRKA